jgi:hypothetical protein
LQTSLYIGNLIPADSRELEELLGRFGPVRYAAVVAAEGRTAGSRFGVVGMQSEGDARSAIRALDGFEIRGVLLNVRWATSLEQTACGHPVMFGTMNMPGGDERDGAPGADTSAAFQRPKS